VLVLFARWRAHDSFSGAEKTTMSRRLVWARALLGYSVAALVPSVAAVCLLDLWKADFHVPFDYGGDALAYAMIVKSSCDHGWYLTNPSLGAPGVFEMHDFLGVAPDSFHLLLIKLLSVFSQDWALLFNIYFLLGFPLISLSTVAVFRQFRIGYCPAIVGGTLYSFLPSRLLKGEAHLSLDVFYQVPLAMLVLLWVCSDDPPLVKNDRAGRWPGLEIRRVRSWGSLLVAALVASTGLYYAFFTTAFLLVGGAWASATRRRIGNAVAGLLLASAIAGGLAANAVPALLYQLRHGPNHDVGVRVTQDAEIYGMKIAQLLLPVDGHRVEALARLKEHYRSTAPLVGENETTSLGLVGDAGFLLLLGVLLSGRRSPGSVESVLRPLSVLNLTAVLMGTIGGFGALFAVLISPQIRTYSRVNVLISFFSLFAVVVLLERLRSRRPRAAFIAIPLVLVLGLLDQVTPYAVRSYAATKRQYSSDAGLVRRIEAMVPRDTAIFELPFMTFPEGPPINGLQGYDPVRLYLHSQHLRWSFPTMRGRPGDSWAADVSRLEPLRMVKALKDAGFGGILLDRGGYADNGCAIEAAFRTILGEDALVSEHQRYVFLRLSDCAGDGRPCGVFAQACGEDRPCPSGVCNRGRCQCGVLASGQTLASNASLLSCDGRFSLTMHGDGELVLAGCGCSALGGVCWGSHTGGHPGAAATMGTDGNLVISGPACPGGGGTCWTSGSSGQPGAFVRLQDDGNVCIFGDQCTGANATCWCTNSCCH
jgi:phosphoglycerol transferase